MEHSPARFVQAGFGSLLHTIRPLLVSAVLFPCCFLGCSSNDGDLQSIYSKREAREEAIRKLRTQAVADPSNAKVWKELGQQLLGRSAAMIWWWDNEYSDIWVETEWHKAERLIDEALHAFRKGLQFDPSDAQLHALAGHAMLTKFEHDPDLNETSRLTEAIAFLERSVALEPRMLEALIDLGLAWTPSWRSEGDIQKARGYVERAMKLEPNNGMVQYALAGLLEAEGDDSGALSTLMKALELGVGDDVVYIEISRRYSRVYERLSSSRDDEKGTKPTFIQRFQRNIMSVIFHTSTPFRQWIEVGAGRRAISTGTDNPYYYLIIGDGCRWGFGKDKALGFYKKAFVLDTLHSFFRYYWWEKDMRDWIREYSRQHPNDYYAQIAVGDSYVDWYERENKDSLLQLRRSAYLAAIRLRPDVGIAYVGLGRTYERTKTPEQAGEYFKKALPLQFDEAESILGAASFFVEHEKFDEASLFYKRLLDLDLVPRVAVLRWMGYVQRNQRDHGPAHAIYLDLDRAYPGMIKSNWEGRSAANSIAEAYESKGEYDKAIDVLKSSLGNDRWKHAFPHSTVPTQSYVLIGKLYSRKGDFDKALAYFETAVRQDDESREGLLSLADEYARRNMREKAIENYRKAAWLNVIAAKKALQKMGVPEVAPKMQ